MDIHMGMKIKTDMDGKYKYRSTYMKQMSMSMYLQNVFDQRLMSILWKNVASERESESRDAIIQLPFGKTVPLSKAEHL